MSRTPFDFTPYIDAAKRVVGGHLKIGRGGYTIHDGTSSLSGYDCEPVKTACIAAGLPVIDSRMAAIEAVAALAVRGPLIAVGREPDPAPWHPYAHAPLGIVAAAYRKAGAEISNIPDAELGPPDFRDLAEGPLKTWLADWENHVLNNGF
jgi:hypothetical protein